MKPVWSLTSILLLATACNLELETKNEGLRDVDSSAAYGVAALDVATPDATPEVADLPVETQDSVRVDRTRLLDTAAIRPGNIVDTRGVQPKDLVAFAHTQIGVPYLYGSTNPAAGFDCSGFITYVFNHFKISVPRSSRDFTQVGKEIPEAAARPGDLILFTGTDSTETFVGHMGIVTNSAPDTIKFIHSTSGKAYGVTVTPFNNYYRSRFVKFIRVFPENDRKLSRY